MRRWRMPGLAVSGIFLLLLYFMVGPHVVEQARNYEDPAGPRYAGTFAVADADPRLRVATFNVRYARQMDLASELFEREEGLRGVDVLALQEMDAPGVEHIARRLRMSYVYYPGAWHPSGQKDFGPAVLTRGTIEESHKLVLPHRSHFRGMQRIATAATVRVDGLAVRVYSVHLEAPIDIGPRQRRGQLDALIADAQRGSGPVIVAGDFNSYDVAGEMMEKAGYTWLTRPLPRTLRFFTWDQIFMRNVPVRTAPATGVVLDVDGASDHKPVWAHIELDRFEASLGR